jgi:integrase
MPKQDPLITGAMNARLQGSAKTVMQHKDEAQRFVSELRELGYGVQRWENVSNKHVAEVAEAWVDRGLAAATVKEYLSGVRAVANAYGNEQIRERNDFKNDAGEVIVPARVYVTNEDKAVPQDVYERAVERLGSGEFGEDGQRLAAQMGLMRELGLRHEEARKFVPDDVIQADGRLHIHRGCKGGRERMMPEPTERQQAAIDAIRPWMSERWHNSMPDGMREKTWEDRAYSLATAVGVTKEACGASFHGLRHAYAMERYESLTGFRSPSVGGSVEEAKGIAGDGWKKLDQDARNLLKAEMGHGPDRDTIVSTYIGSWSK